MPKQETPTSNHNTSQPRKKYTIENVYKTSVLLCTNNNNFDPTSSHHHPDVHKPQ
jgi:hypothetical protein